MGHARAGPATASRPAPRPATEVGRPDDPAEERADRLADRVLASAPGPHAALAAGLARIPTGPSSGPRDTGPGPAGLGPGRSLDGATKAFFEPRFGRDLGHVTLHDGSVGAQAAASVGARAVTVGSRIALNSDEGDPASAAGRRLLAHEIAHVVQEPAGRASPVARRQPLRTGGGVRGGSVGTTGGAVTAAPLPMEQDLVRFGKEEAESLRTVAPGPGQEPRSAVTGNVSTGPEPGQQDLHYDTSAAASGRRGSIVSHTVLHLHHEPEKEVVVQPYNPEFHLVGDPHLARTYPVTITYDRTIAYTDDYGRNLDVEVHASLVFTHDAWDSAMANLSGEMTLAGLASLQGSAGSMSVRLLGRGDLATVMARDHPSMPAEIRDPILAERRSSYLAMVSVTGTSLSFMSGDVAAGLERTQDSFPIHLTDVPGDFVYLDRTAGRQYDEVRAYLESWDAVDIAEWVKEIQQRLKDPGILVRGAPRSAADRDSGPSWLDRVFGAIGRFWNGLPAPLRATLKVLGKAAATVGVILGAAALIVALAPVELTVAGVALAIGAAIMIGSFFHSIYVRSVESVDTGSGNPFTVFLVAVGDTIGITAIVEGITNESVLSGRPLGMDEEGRWERSVGGGLQLVLTLLGVRSLLKGRPPVTELPAEPTTATPQLRPGGAASEPPVFEGLTDAEVGQAVEGAESPSATGGRTDPRIGGRRVPTSRRPILDLEGIPRRVGETARQALGRINRVITHVLDEFPALRDAWQRARDQVLADKGPLTRENYAELYDATRNQFWRNVRDSELARQMFEGAGFEFPAGRSTAPVLRGAPGGMSAQEFRISLDHLAEKAIGDNWTRALDADNLQMEFQNPNSYREAIQARHPDLRLPPPPPAVEE